MSSSPPTTLGKYQIIREIARSNDIVYEAYDPVMNRRVAVKELAVATGSTPQHRDERKQRFLREARAAGSLVHPNIVTVFEVGQDGDRSYIAMEYLDGHNLRNELDTHGEVQTEKACTIAMEVLKALSHAHAHGVVHRDVKPDNIQLLESGAIKITDFGIARITFEPNLTMDGQVFGTPSYMSPEQVAGKEIDARSDIFGLGVVLYEMLAGKKPFAGDSVISITYAIVNANPEQPANVNYSLWQILQKALDKSPTMRYRDAEEMIRDLETAKRLIAQGDVILDPMRHTTTTIPAYGHPQQPQFQTPYGGPVPPPATYGAYNPYQMPQAAPAQNQYMQAGQYPPGYVPPHYPGSQIPVYIPPPKRPLLKPETEIFLGKLFWSILIMGVIAGIVIGAIYFVTKSNSPGVPVQSGRIQERPDWMNPSQPQSRPAPTAEDRARADNKMASGRNAAEAGKMDAAEQYYREAQALVPDDPRPLADLGQLYHSQGLQQPESVEAAIDFESAGDYYMAAVQATSNANDAANLKDFAIRNLLASAQIFENISNKRDARRVAKKGIAACAEDDPRLVEFYSIRYRTGG